MEFYSINFTGYTNFYNLNYPNDFNDELSTILEIAMEYTSSNQTNGSISTTADIININTGEVVFTIKNGEIIYNSFETTDRAI